MIEIAAGILLAVFILGVLSDWASRDRGRYPSRKDMEEYDAACRAAWRKNPERFEPMSRLTIACIWAVLVAITTVTALLDKPPSPLSPTSQEEAIRK